MDDVVGGMLVLDGEAIAVSAWDDEIFRESSAIYEVIRIEEGVPLFFDDYFERLQNSFHLINQPLSFSNDDLKSMIYKLLEINGSDNGPVKLMFGINDSVYSLIYLMQPHVPTIAEYDTGVHTILLHKERLNPNAKIWNQQIRDTTNLQLKRANAYEGILLDEKGFVTEGSRSNIFFIKNGIVYTTPDEFILPGITRKKVLQLCNSMGIEVYMKRIHSSDISTYDAAFITGTSRKVLPIKTIDTINFAMENDTMQKIITEFENLVLAYIHEAKNS